MNADGIFPAAADKLISRADAIADLSWTKVFLSTSTCSNEKSNLQWFFLPKSRSVVNFTSLHLKYLKSPNRTACFPLESSGMLRVWLVLGILGWNFSPSSVEGALMSNPDLEGISAQEELPGLDEN